MCVSQKGNVQKKLKNDNKRCPAATRPEVLFWQNLLYARFNANCIGIDIIFRNLLKKDDGGNNLPYPYLNYKSYGKDLRLKDISGALVRRGKISARYIQLK